MKIRSGFYWARLRGEAPGRESWTVVELRDAGRGQEVDGMGFYGHGVDVVAVWGARIEPTKTAALVEEGKQAGMARSSTALERQAEEHKTMNQDRDQGPGAQRVARLTLAIERDDGTVVAEDMILQASGESDDHLLQRGAIVLEHLRHRNQSPDTLTRLTLAIERGDGTVVAKDAIAQVRGESDSVFLRSGALLLEYLRNRGQTNDGVARLTLAIERGDGTVVAEDAVLQAQGESDHHLLDRGAILLEYLRHRTQVTEPPRDDQERVADPWPGVTPEALREAGIDEEHQRVLATLVRVGRSWASLADAIVGGVRTACRSPGSGDGTRDVRPGTAPYDVLRRYRSLRDPSDVRPPATRWHTAEGERSVLAISALLGALRVHPASPGDAPSPAAPAGGTP